MKSKEEIIQSVEYIFENTKRIHGNSEALDWQKIAIHKSVSYILSEFIELKQQLVEATEVKSKEKLDKELFDLEQKLDIPFKDRYYHSIAPNEDKNTEATEPIKKLVEIRGENDGCANCKHGDKPYFSEFPCTICNDLYSKWEPKTE